MSLRIAISLGASFLGYATHAGFLARLHELGVRPVAVGGSSAGAISAGLYAAGLAPEIVRELVCSAKFRQSFIRRTPWLYHYIFNTFHEHNIALFKPDGAVEHLESVLGKRQIEELNAPRFMAAISDLEAARTRFLSSGSLAHAMVASCCVPTVFTPLKHEGMLCFDGGVAHEAPIDPWIEDEKVDLIVIHRIAHIEKPMPKFFPFNMIQLMAKVHTCAGAQLLEYRLRLAELHGKKVLITETPHERPSLVSSAMMPSFYEAGAAQAERFFESTLKPLIQRESSASRVE